MLEGIAQVVSVLRDAPRKEGGWRGQLLDRIESEALDILLFNFDSDGLARENTIGYHNYNITCFQKLLSVCEQFHLPVDMRKIQEIMPKLNHVMRQLIWPNGMNPPVGDSQIYPTGLESINRDHYYREANWLVLKNQDRYCSFRCVFTRRTHKHVDESCVTLRYKDRDILIDSGSYNYDQEDPIRQYLESARGHSGCYPLSLYPYLGREYCVKVHRASKIQNVRQQNGTTWAQGFLELKNGFHLKREIVERQGELLLLDDFLPSRDKRDK